MRIPTNEDYERELLLLRAKLSDVLRNFHRNSCYPEATEIAIVRVGEEALGMKPEAKH